MGLETATFIDDLVATNPANTDGKSQGDDHLRLIKDVLQNQFPNLGGEALLTTAAELNAIVINNAFVPAGAIVIWSGSIASIPTGWFLCDGNNGTPDLDDLFVAGTTDEPDVGTTGGTLIHTHTIQGHTLIPTEMPGHTHKTVSAGENVTPITSGNHIAQISTSGADDAYDLGSNGAGATLGVTSPTGGDGSHDHTADGESHVPPFYKLAYIMKA